MVNSESMQSDCSDHYHGMIIRTNTKGMGIRMKIKMIPKVKGRSVITGHQVTPQSLNMWNLVF